MARLRKTHSGYIAEDAKGVFAGPSHDRATISQAVAEGRPKAKRKRKAKAKVEEPPEVTPEGGE